MSASLSVKWLLRCRSCHNGFVVIISHMRLVEHEERNFLVVAMELLLSQTRFCSAVIGFTYTTCNIIVEFSSSHIAVSFSIHGVFTHKDRKNRRQILTGKERCP